MDGDWVPSTRAGVEVKRPKGSKTPCWKCPKLSAEDQRKNPRPEYATEMSEQNWKMWQYYNEVQAGATMHDDLVTRRACGELRRVEREIERRKERDRGT